MNPKIVGVVTLILAMAIESLAQMALKVGSAGGPAILATPYRRWAHQFKILSAAGAWITIGVVFYGFEVFLWTLVLHLLDVSVAFPMGSLCFVGVALLSKFFLGERVGRMRWLGVSCILFGTTLMTL
jgi:multidrug transporter EmrE-like cation transporter